MSEIYQPTRNQDWNPPVPKPVTIQTPRRFWRRASLACLVVAGVIGLPSITQAQMFFEASWLQWDRDNDVSSGFITGPEAISTGSLDYSSKPGYRLTFGSAIGDYQLDTSFSQITTWGGQTSGTFTNPVVFDDSAANPFVVATPPGNSLSPQTGLSMASRYNTAGIDDESTEGELLQSGSSYFLSTKSDYRDFEINIGTNRELRWWRVSVGYRHIRLDEQSLSQLGGIFDAIDVNDGAVAGDMTNDPNDGLSNTALDSAGFTLVSGSGDGFDAFNSMAGPDTITYQLAGNAKNELNGAQFTGAVQFFANDWFSIEGIGKAGIYRNDASGLVQETVVGSINDDSAYRRTYTSSDLSVAFAGNLGLRGVIGLTDYINLVGGYEVLFLSGVALGGDQVNGLSTDLLGETHYQVRTNGSMIAHGGNLGLELLW